AVAGAATTIPDWIEGPIYRLGLRVGSLIPHRTITHWPVLWLVLLWWGLSFEGVVGAAMFGTAIGALVDILGDAPNPMGIPWLWPTRRIRFGKKGWWRSGENELFLIVFFTVVGVVTWGFANPELKVFRTIYELALSAVRS